MAIATMEIKGGWAVVSDGWAVFGTTMEEAMANYQEALERHARIMARPVDTEDRRENDEVTEASHL